MLYMWIIFGSVTDDSLAAEKVQVTLHRRKLTNFITNVELVRTALPQPLENNKMV